LAAAIFTPQVTAIADALIQANLARAELTAEQARSSSLTQLRSFNQRVQVASVAVQTEMTLIGKALDSPSP
jgi:phage terminase Nu1 subunit (DNA packaging protein)